VAVSQCCQTAKRGAPAGNDPGVVSWQQEMSTPGLQGEGSGSVMMMGRMVGCTGEGIQE
jgi:hypothetical protein